MPFVWQHTSSLSHCNKNQIHASLMSSNPPLAQDYSFLALNATGSQVFSVITCSDGGWPHEVGWTLACSDNTTLSGGNPYDSICPLAVSPNATCTLSMTDSYGDGWNGAKWVAPGFDLSFSLDGHGRRKGAESFVVPMQSVSPSPPPPLPRLPPLLPPPLPPPLPPASPTAEGDSRFGCGYAGTHLAAVNSSNALALAVEDINITCIKLDTTVYTLTATLFIDRTLALVAEEGRATLDGNGSVQLMHMGTNALVSLHNIELSNGGQYMLVSKHRRNLAPNRALSSVTRCSPQTGGAIHNNLGTIMMYTCIMRANKAMMGGAIYNTGTIKLYACVFRANNAKVVRAVVPTSLCHSCGFLLCGRCRGGRADPWCAVCGAVGRRHHEHGHNGDVRM